MFKIGIENRDFCKLLHFHIVDAGKKQKKTKKNELHLLACSAALCPSGRGHRPKGDALTIFFLCCGPLASALILLSCDISLKHSALSKFSFTRLTLN